MSLTRRLHLALLLGLLTGMVSPLAASGFSQGLAATSPQIVHVTIINGAGITQTSPGFSPNQITVVIGVNNTVVWTDQDTTMDANQYLPNHTVHANDSSFKSGTLDGGNSFNYTFTSQGTFGYHCDFHPWMKGTVVVKLAATTSTTTSTKTSTTPEFPTAALGVILFVVMAALILAAPRLASGRTKSGLVP